MLAASLSVALRMSASRFVDVCGRSCIVYCGMEFFFLVKVLRIIYLSVEILFVSFLVVLQDVQDQALPC